MFIALGRTVLNKFTYIKLRFCAALARPNIYIFFNKNTVKKVDVHYIEKVYLRYQYFNVSKKKSTAPAVRAGWIE